MNMPGQLVLFPLAQAAGARTTTAQPGAGLNQYFLDVRAIDAGAILTVAIQTSADGNTWSTAGSFTASVIGTQVLKIGPKAFVRTSYALSSGSATFQVTAPVPVVQIKLGILRTLYTIYATAGFGAQANSPQLSQLAPDADTQAVLADMGQSKPFNWIDTAQIDDPTKLALRPRPQITVYYLTIAGAKTFEAIDPNNPPANL